MNFREKANQLRFNKVNVGDVVILHSIALDYSFDYAHLVIKRDRRAGKEDILRTRDMATGQSSVLRHNDFLILTDISVISSDQR